MKVIKTLVATCMAASIVNSSFAVDFSQVDSLVNSMKQQSDFPYGTAIAVVKGNEIIYQGYFGYSDIENKIKVSASTPFYIASITKPYFALAMLLKEHNKQINETTSMAAMFPALGFKNIDAKQITMKHLLTHTMGIENSPLAMVTAYRGGHDLAERQHLVATSYPNPNAPLGTFDYSNVGYNIMSVWAELTDQKPWQSMLNEVIFQPLALTHTSAYISDTEKQSWHLTKPYSIAELNRKPLYLSKQDDTMHAAGGMISSAKDMARFLIAQLNNGQVNDKQIFPAEVIKKSQQPVASLEKSYGEFKRQHYAWGWYIGPYLNQTLYHHFGGYPGTHSHLSFMPEKDIGVVILNNEDMLSSKFTGIVAKLIYSLLLNEQNANHVANKEIQSLHNRLAQLSKHLTQKQQQVKERSWQLSLSQEQYEGIYEHDQMGEIAITLNKNKELKINWGHLNATASAYTQPESIRVELIPNDGEIIQFVLDNDKITGLIYNKMTFLKQ